MPHKHVRKEGNNGSNFDLAPSVIAKPLPAFSQDINGKKKQSQQRQRHRGIKRKNTDTDYAADDTPRAFARLMRLQSTGGKQERGLDDGEGRIRRKKLQTAQSNSSSRQEPPAGQQEKVDLPKIKPGERLGDFAARVNQALPVGGLARRGKIKGDGGKERQTKTEKRLHKMYAAWRVEEARRKERLEEQQEEEEDEEDEREAAMGGQSLHVEHGGTTSRRRRVIGELKGGDGDDDPWAELKMKREKPRSLHDVAQAPPSLKVVPREKFKVRNGAKVDVANIPTAAGSLKRREELSDARKEVIERYRTMMKGSRSLEEDHR